MHKILLIGEFHSGSLGLYYERAFQSLGCSVTRYDYGAAYSVPSPLPNIPVLRRALRPYLWRRMNRDVVSLASERLDLIVAIKAPFLEGATVDCLRSCCNRAVMIYPDSPWEAYTQRGDIIPILSRFARTYIWSHSLVDRLCDSGVDARYLAFGYDREYEEGDSRTQTGIAFAAQPYPNRIEWLRQLEGLPVSVYGAQWRQSWFGGNSSIRVDRRTPMGAEAARIYASSAIGLNIAHPQNLTGHNMRTFEIPAAGALMMASYTEDLNCYFPDGQACLIASRAQQFREHCLWALNHPSQAVEIAVRGRELVRPHSYATRAMQLLQDLRLAPTAPCSFAEPLRSKSNPDGRLLA
jgi:Glycosyl transferases group 1